MKVFTAVALVGAVSLTAAGCASSHDTGTGITRKSVVPPGGTTSVIPLHISGAARLPSSLMNQIRSIIKTSPPTGAEAVSRIEVYGPGSRSALVKASSGDLVDESAGKRTPNSYLIVLHGHFVAGSHPAGTKAPRGTIETQVWSPAAGVTDSGISNRLPGAVLRLHRLAAITL